MEQRQMSPERHIPSPIKYGFINIGIAIMG